VPAAVDPAEPTLAEIEAMVAWLRDYAPTYREMGQRDLRAAAEGRLRLPARRAADKKRLEMRERMGKAREVAQAAQEMDLTW
jgi:hypothetical protein